MLRALTLFVALCLALIVPISALAQNTPSAFVAQMPEMPSGRLAHILQRGSLIVGVKDDYPPWGMRGPEGAIIGLEPDLARDLADRIGVELELEAVTASNRIGLVNQGRVDVVIATAGDTAERRDQADLLQPNYYSSGVVVYGRVDAGLKGWDSLRGEKVCLNRGAYYNRNLEETRGVEGQYFSANRDSRLALRQGRCIGWAFDDTALAQLILREPSDDFEMMEETILESPWAVIVAKGEGDGDLGRFVSDVIIEWHVSGQILDLQSKWGIPQTAFLRTQQELWSTFENGRPVCSRDPTTNLLNVECLYEAPRRSAPLVSTPLWMSTLAEKTGIELTALASSYNQQRLMRALGLTLSLSAFAIIGALLVGIVLSLSQAALSCFGLLGKLMLLPQKVLITVARMTPPILQLYIVFFGLGGILGNPDGFVPGSFGIATSILSLYAGATITIILTHALDAEREANPHAGLVSCLPAALSRGFDGVIAACVNIVKAAGMASAIAVSELVSTVDLLVSEGADTATLMNGLLVFYFLLVLVLLSIFRAVRRRLVRA